MDRRQFLAASSVTLFAGSMVRAAANDRKLRVGVIGHTGRGNFGHGLDTVWLKSPELFEIVAVADADADGLRAAQSKLKLGEGFADYRKMLEAAKPDVVAVCPRHVDQHLEMSLAAIAAGAKGLYIEKPFVRSCAEADAVLAAAAKSNTKIAVAHRNRYYPAVPAIDKFLASGKLGKLLEVRCRGKEDARGGALDLWVLGTHVVNLAHHFAGRPTACSAVLLKDGKPVTKADIVEGGDAIGPVAGNELHARFETESGVPLFLDSVANRGSKKAGFGLQLVGSEGLIDIRFDDPKFASFVPGEPFLPTDKPRPWLPLTSAGVGEPEPNKDALADAADHTTAVRDLATAIRDDREPLCSGADAAVTVEMVCATFESHRLGGSRVTLPLKTRENPLTLL